MRIRAAFVRAWITRLPDGHDLPARNFGEPWFEPSDTWRRRLPAACSFTDWRTLWTFAIRLGLVTGLTTAIGTAVNPYIEYYADNLPERRLGVIGVGLILCGFALQSVQYWLALFDVRVT